MNGKELPATKAAKKNTENSSRKSGRGGARAGAGRKPSALPTKPISVDIPEILFEAMDISKVKNRTAFIIFCLSKTMRDYPAIKKSSKIRAELDKIINDPKISF